MKKKKLLTWKDLDNMRIGAVVYAAETINMIRGKVPAGTRGKVTYITRCGFLRGVSVEFDNGIKTMNAIVPNLLTRDK